MIVGIDEAGRGPLAGAVVGCALYLESDVPFVVRDSKELSAGKREAIFEWLMSNAIYSVNIATAQEIDKINILNATFLTFNRAIGDLIEKVPKLKEAEFIIDGNAFKTSLDVNYRCMVKADKKVKEVSCASIVAKVTRDYLMGIADFTYPEYNFFKHKGYPTKEHFLAVAKHSLSPIHRKSFNSKL
ncbi:MAG: ribonuclease HII [Candidatus Omnitrophica bacterium]|nr:ribonuclease HII [Candidatus Omnitrophota bacterium]